MKLLPGLVGSNSHMWGERNQVVKLSTLPKAVKCALST